MLETILKVATSVTEKIPGISSIISAGLEKLARLRERVLAKFGEGSEKLGFLGKFLEPLKKKYAELERGALKIAADAGVDLDSILGESEVRPESAEVARAASGEKLLTCLAEDEDPDALQVAKAGITDLAEMRKAEDLEEFRKAFDPLWGGAMQHGDKIKNAFDGSGALGLATRLLGDKLPDALTMDRKNTSEVVDFVAENILPRTNRKLLKPVLEALVEKKPIKKDDVAKLLYEMDGQDFEKLSKAIS